LKSCRFSLVPDRVVSSAFFWSLQAMWETHVSSDGKFSTIFDGFDVMSSTQVVKNTSFDFMDTYATLMMFESDPSGLEEPKPLWVRWSSGRDEVHSHLCTRVSQRVHAHQFHQTSFSDAACVGREQFPSVHDIMSHVSSDEMNTTPTI
jgi:hypothetical protein